MRYLITGGAGFIGSHLAEELVTRGHHVHVYDNLSTGRLARDLPSGSGDQLRAHVCAGRDFNRNYYGSAGTVDDFRVLTGSDAETEPSHSTTAVTPYVCLNW